MSNDLVPHGAPWWDHLNLPEIVAGPAGKAISRLIGASADIPAAGIERLVQGIRNKTAAKQKISDALADAAAKMAVADQDLVRRAADSFLSKELRRQSNKEAVAQKTIEHLSSTPDQPSASAPEDDWLNVFERYAEDASSERLQDLWGRILAGQLRKPKGFSLSTLRFVSELDQQAASLFEQVADSVVNGDMIPRTKVDDLQPRVRLEELGLISGATGMLVRNFTIDEEYVFFGYRTHAVRVIAQKGTKLSVPAMPLTQVGREIYSILSPTNAVQHAREFAQVINKQGVQRIELAPLTPNRSEYITAEVIVLWESPKPEAVSQPSPPA